MKIPGKKFGHRRLLKPFCKKKRIEHPVGLALHVAAAAIAVGVGVLLYRRGSCACGCHKKEMQRKGSCWYH